MSVTTKHPECTETSSTCRAVQHTVRARDHLGLQKMEAPTGTSATTSPRRPRARQAPSHLKDVGSKARRDKARCSEEDRDPRDHRGIRQDLKEQTGYEEVRAVLVRYVAAA